jgi:acyl-lipid (7-3)-desaturase (Delta-4 desaturase)
MIAVMNRMNALPGRGMSVTTDRGKRVNSSSSSSSSSSCSRYSITSRRRHQHGFNDERTRTRAVTTKTIEVRMNQQQRQQRQQREQQEQQRRNQEQRNGIRTSAVAIPGVFGKEKVQAPRPDCAKEGAIEDPWNDPKWKDTRWTIYRGTAYDLGPFFEKHPGGNWLLNLAIGRDSTALLESYHLRPEVAVARFRMLPVLEGFPVDQVPKSPRPNDSALYNAIRTRVRTELFPEEGKNKHRQGGDFATCVILGFAVFAYSIYYMFPSVLSGALLGLAGAWIGLTIQHCANHGAMSPSPIVNNLLGLTDDLIGGSSLMWRYHHQVSHHIHCNDNALDQDVFTAMPLLRFDARRERKWFHKFQHIYLFLAFPMMQVAFQVGDIVGLFTKDTEGAKLHGATALELSTVVIGKIAHFSLLLAPLANHATASILAGIASFVAVQGMVLACTFAVSHNVAEAKIPEDTGGEAWERDWGVQQLVTSADWGGKIGNFFTGGLNLQVEHHLFPAICFVHYPAIAKIVKEEAAKFGINYASYRTLPGIFIQFMKFVKDMGVADQIGDILTVKNKNNKLALQIDIAKTALNSQANNDKNDGTSSSWDIQRGLARRMFNLQ